MNKSGNPAGVLLIGLVVSCFCFIANILFYGELRAPWVLMLMPPLLIIADVFSVAFLEMLSGNTSRMKKKKREIVFDVLAILYRAGHIALVCATALHWALSQSPLNWAIYLAGVILLVVTIALSFLAETARIYIRKSA